MYISKPSELMVKRYARDRVEVFPGKRVGDAMDFPADGGSHLCCLQNRGSQ